MPTPGHILQQPLSTNVQPLDMFEFLKQSNNDTYRVGLEDLFISGGTIRIREHGWFLANASTVFPRGNMFVYSNPEHPLGTGVVKITNGTLPLSLLPIMMFNYKMAGGFDSNCQASIVNHVSGNVMMMSTRSVVGNSDINNTTVLMPFIIPFPCRITAIHFFVNSVTGTQTVKVKLFRYVIATDTFVEVANGSAGINLTGQRFVNLSTPYNALPYFYAVGMYANTTQITFRNNQNFYSMPGIQKGAFSASGDVTTANYSDFTQTTNFIVGVQYSNLI